MQSRQAVNHAHFLVNGKKVNIPSYQLEVGDIISLKEKMKESTLYKSLLEDFQAFSSKNSSAKITQSSWLTVNPKELTITVSAVPEKKDFDNMIDVARIIEFYSK
jgi:small subunit ribosomal protein S4